MARKAFRRIGGRLVPAYPNAIRPKYDGNPQKGMEGAALKRDGTPVDPKAANQLKREMDAERAKRIQEQGHA
jgi:hypothetical protein